MPRLKGKKKKISRHVEIEDPPGTFERKCQQLANALRKSKGTVVYTGAGISTAASIPDYRGPNGVWTAARKGLASTVNYCDPVEASPTFSHMALRELYRRGLVQHILSQNCDGFHLRSGLPQSSLSEIHGNMHIEVCRSCDPIRQYIRPYDVTDKTGFRRHKTGRQCTVCYASLEDTIVHFGEYGKARWPLNWEGILDILQNRNCSIILCLGSSLQIVQKYKHLWCDDRPKHLRPKLYIVNLQWTPKDRVAKAKINAKCDSVMNRVMEILNFTVPPYCRRCDTVLNSRHRNTRNKELMDAIVSCACKVPSDSRSESHLIDMNKAVTEDEDLSKSQKPKVPGWWKVGLNLLTSSKKSISNSNPFQKEKDVSSRRGRGRPKKRKMSSDDPDYIPTKIATTKGTQKRKRGRPRKEVPTNLEDPSPPPKKSPMSLSEEDLERELKIRTVNDIVNSVVESLHRSFLEERLMTLRLNGALERMMLLKDVYDTVESLIVTVEQMEEGR